MQAANEQGSTWRDGRTPSENVATYDPRAILLVGGCERSQAEVAERLRGAGLEIEIVRDVDGAAPAMASGRYLAVILSDSLPVRVSDVAPFYEGAVTVMVRSRPKAEPVLEIRGLLGKPYAWQMLDDVSKRLGPRACHPSRRRSILIADPDVVTRHEVATRLRRLGWGVAEASSSDEVRSLICGLSWPIGLVFGTADLGGSTSVGSLASWIRTNAPSVDFVHIEAEGSIRDRSELSEERIPSASLLQSARDLGRLDVEGS